jgi:acyl carrier protein
MTDLAQISAQLLGVFRDVFDDESLILSRELSAEQVAGWNSITHLRLMLAVQRVFNVRFSAAEIGRLRNVEDLMDLILAKLQAAA